MDSRGWGYHPGQKRATIAPCPWGADERELLCTAMSSPMKTRRPWRGPGRSQMRLQLTALLQTNALPLIDILAARKRMSKTSADDQAEATCSRAYVAFMHIVAKQTCQFFFSFFLI